ncbi:GH3 family domain-containing protein [Xenorhabdus anantnagensis]|uniref:GH3 auxin-responsive promoter family protein n=1 Tax=Xenorhabdus anantnagensis TaxID=3025875 RepID=A0ABT5LYF6_9GAMM|nr:GH3 auxin-responsive promoter family protein [Xenorhabdus anantnagensis]MDC9598791.1 GH3 auxin-responsive promoter family protein [Xenorhabdus anantnagensis]
MNLYDESLKSLFKTRTEFFKNEFIEKIQNPVAAQKEVLSDLADITRDADFWQEKKANLSNIEEFKKSVPISSYGYFEEAIKKEIITKGGIITNSPVIRWLKTSGTTGNPKYIPYTYHWMQKYRIPAMYTMWDTFINACPHILLQKYSVLDTQTTREAVQPNVCGLSHQSISNRYPHINDNDWTPPWNNEPWYNENMPNDHDGRSYSRLRYFLGKDLRAITAINPSMILSLYDKLNIFKDSLVKDIYDGTLQGEKCNNFSPDPKMAKKFENRFAKNDFTLCDVWPKLSFYSCWTSAGASYYLTRLNEIIPGATIVPFMTCGTEGVTTIPICPDIESQPLAINQAIFEFIPAEIDPEKWIGKYEQNTLSPMELEPGKRYHIIMSQAHGLLRMWTGDIFEVTEVTPEGTPWMFFVERYGVFNSFTGEKLTHQDLSVAFEKTFKAQEGQKMPYLIAPKWDTIPYYISVVESLRGIDAEMFAKELDKEIATVNIEYASKRDSGRLAAPKVFVCPPDTLRQYFEHGRNAKNGNQHKFKHHQTDSSIVENFWK